MRRLNFPSVIGENHFSWDSGGGFMRENSAETKIHIAGFEFESLFSVMLIPNLCGDRNK